MNPADAVPGATVAQFCTALVAETPLAAQAYADRLIERGVSVETFYDTLIPNAAARLGEMWLDDTLSFSAVTLGTSRLTEVFRRLSPIYLRARQALERPPRALLATVPGEQHVLGVVMAADRFQRAGWSVRVELNTTPSRLSTLVGASRFDAIGLSAGGRRMADRAAETIVAIRAAGARDVPVLIGGAIVGLEAGIAGKVGADHAFASAADAVARLESGFWDPPGASMVPRFIRE